MKGGKSRLFGARFGLIVAVGALEQWGDAPRQDRQGSREFDPFLVFGGCVSSTRKTVWHLELRTANGTQECFVCPFRTYCSVVTEQTPVLGDSSSRAFFGGRDVVDVERKCRHSEVLSLCLDVRVGRGEKS